MANNDSKSNKYAYLDQLSTDQLEELLRSADIGFSEDDDVDIIYYILEVIGKRKEDSLVNNLPNAEIEKAWEEFRSIYCAPEGNGKSLYPMDEIHSVAPAPNSFTSYHRVHLLRRILAVAAIVICLVIFMLPAALGFENFFEMIGKWSDDTFYFAPSSSSIPSPESDNVGAVLPANNIHLSLQDALNDYGVTEQILPTWFPSGFILEDLYVSPPSTADDKVTFGAFYINGEQSIILTYIYHPSDINESWSYEKDSAEVKEYVVSGQKYYLYQNLDQNCAAWQNENVECSISGDLTLDELKKMIDSITEE